MGLPLPRSFVDHPRSVGETYGEHFAVATGFGLRLIAAGLACLVHACVPAWFTRIGQPRRARARVRARERARGR